MSYSSPSSDIMHPAAEINLLVIPETSQLGFFHRELDYESDY